jgi:hypothetical protein
MGEEEIRYYYLDTNKQATGPFEHAELIELWKEGKITPRTPVVQEGGDLWVEFSELFSPTAPSVSRPAAIKVFGILNIIFGAFALFSTSVAILIHFVYGSDVLIPFGGTVYKIYFKVSSLLGFAGSILMLVSGIGLCSFREWARKIAIGYAWYSIAACLLGLAVTLLVILPEVREMGCQGAYVGGLVGGMLGGIIGMIYPVLLIIFLSRARVKTALRNPGAALNQIDRSGRSGFEVYEAVAQTVGLIPSLRLKDNLIQGVVIALGGLVGLSLGILLGGSSWALLGSLIGLVSSLLLSGFVLMIVGFVRVIRGKKGT